MIKKEIYRIGIAAMVVASAVMSLVSCSESSSREKEEMEKPLALSVYTVQRSDAETVKDYLGTVEGKVNVEVRTQVEGLLEEIFVDEGAYVQKGQNLFRIDPSVYQEELNNAIATEQVAKAQLENAQLEVDRLKPLVDNEVISPVRLSAVQSDYAVAKATLDQASAAVRSAEINRDFTIIKAPVSGYIGRIPKRIGNLITKGDNEPLTFLSEIQEVYVYFAMNESDFLYFSKAQAQQDSIEGVQYNQHNRLTFPEVTLILSDGEEYPIKGVVDAVSGQVDRATGAISLRATFPNQDNILRSGSSGTLKISEVKKNVVQIPQIATSELQDRVFVYVVNEDNVVERRSISIGGRSAGNYIVAEGLQEGERIVLNGWDKLTDGSVIIPVEH